MPGFSPAEAVFLVVLMAVVTYIPRVIPVLVLSRRKLPEPVERWLSYVPVAVLAALLTPVLIAPEGTVDLAVTTNPAFWVSIPVLVIALFTRNLFATVFFGMIMIALLRYFLT